MNNEKPQNPPAFPTGAVTIPGMTLRDYFAAKAMQGLCVNAGRNGYKFSDIDEIAQDAYFIADAMLKQREK